MHEQKNFFLLLTSIHNKSLKSKCAKFRHFYNKNFFGWFMVGRKSENMHSIVNGPLLKSPEFRINTYFPGESYLGQYCRPDSYWWTGIFLGRTTWANIVGPIVFNKLAYPWGKILAHCWEIIPTFPCAKSRGGEPTTGRGQNYWARRASTHRLRPKR